MVRSQRIYNPRTSNATASGSLSSLQKVLYNVTDGANPSVIGLSGYYNQAENLLFSDIQGLTPVTIGTAAGEAIAGSIRDPQPEPVVDVSGAPQVFSTILNYAGGYLSSYVQPALGATVDVVMALTSDSVDPIDPSLDQLRPGTRMVVGGGAPYQLGGSYDISAVPVASAEYTLTFTNGSADVQVSAGHPLINGMAIVFSRTDGGHPGGFNQEQAYFVLGSPNANAGDVAPAGPIQLAAAPGGTAITVNAAPAAGPDFTIRAAVVTLQRRDESALQAPNGIVPVADGAAIPVNYFGASRTTFESVTVPVQTTHITSRINVSMMTKNIVGAAPDSSEGRRASSMLHGNAANISLGPSDPNATTQVVGRIFADSGFHMPEGVELYLPEQLQYLEASGYNSAANQAIGISLEFWTGDYVKWSG